MIFVILGTQDKKFARLIKEVEKLKKEGFIKEKVIVQAGNTKYISDVLEIVDFMSFSDFNENIKNSKYVISHAGAGTIIDALKLDKKIIVVPRLKSYEEHENDHQIQISKEFSELGYIINCNDLSKLDECITKVDNFKPKKFIKNNYKLLNIIKDFISNI